MYNFKIFFTPFRSSKASSTATSAVVGPPPAHGPMTNPPPAHSNSYSTSSTVRNGSYHNSTSAGSGNQNSSNVKKEPSQLSPVKKRIKETKDHQYELYRQQQQLQQQDHSPGKFFFLFLTLFTARGVADQQP